MIAKFTAKELAGNAPARTIAKHKTANLFFIASTFH
jgi:hypothetical protein